MGLEVIGASPGTRRPRFGIWWEWRRALIKKILRACTRIRRMLFLRDIDRHLAGPDQINSPVAESGTRVMLSPGVAWRVMTPLCWSAKLPMRP